MRLRRVRYHETLPWVPSSPVLIFHQCSQCCDGSDQSSLLLMTLVSYPLHRLLFKDLLAQRASVEVVSSGTVWELSGVATGTRLSFPTPETGPGQSQQSPAVRAEHQHVLIM